MKKVLLTQKAADEVLDIVRPYAEIVTVKEGDQDALKQALTDADAVIAGTWVKFDKELIDLAPKLRVISRTGVGVDSVDVEHASQRGILVLNTPSANSLSVAEHAVAMICAMAKALPFLHKSVAQGDWKARRLYRPCDLSGKTLGLVGCGSIGLLTAAKCRSAFQMRVIAYDPFLKKAPEGVELVRAMEDVFAEADFISLHIPLTGETKHIVGAKLIGLMKPSAYLVNTSRGGIIDEEAIFDALKDGRIAGCALDVLENEPPPDGWKFFELDNVLLTPHTAALTKECVLRVALCAAQGVADYLQGREPAFVYNRAKLNL